MRPDGPLGLTDEGLPWIIQAQNFNAANADIRGNQGGVRTTSGRAAIVVDSGLVNCTITAVLGTSFAGLNADVIHAGIAFRSHGATALNYVWVLGNGRLRFQNLSGGSVISTVDSAPGAYSQGAVLTIELNGETITVRSGTDVALTATSAVGFATPSTLHGMMGHTTT